MSATTQAGWLNWANAVTLSRIGFGIACLFVLTVPDRSFLIAGLVLMVVAEATDFLDGYVARLTKSVTDLGKILDPMADSMYRLMIFAVFVQNGWMDAWMLAIFTTRDIGVAYSRMIALQQGKAVSARFSGKLKAVVQGVAQIFVVAVAAFALETLQPWCAPILYFAGAVTLYSLFDYAIAMTRSR